jgi:hypothetical protein
MWFRAHWPPEIWPVHTRQSHFVRQFCRRSSPRCNRRQWLSRIPHGSLPARLCRFSQNPNPTTKAAGMSSKSDRDNRANQLNPNNNAYASSRAGSVGDAEDDDDERRALSDRGTWRPSAPTNLLAIHTVDLVSADGTSTHLVFSTQNGRPPSGPSLSSALGRAF